jgi:hypothetical protein
MTLADAFTASALFLVGYITRFALTGVVVYWMLYRLPV